MSRSAQQTAERLREILAGEIEALERARGTDAEASAERAVRSTRAAIESTGTGEQEGTLRYDPR